jgi:hypothetical protein
MKKAGRFSRSVFLYSRRRMALLPFFRCRKKENR